MLPALRNFISRILNVFRRARLETDLDNDIRNHLEMLQERFVRQGMSPENARFAARRSFGGIDQLKERHREDWSFMFLDHMRQDLRYGFRTLTKSPTFTLIAVATLALGIGANTAIFSVVHAVLLEPLPYREPDRLVRIIKTETDDDGAPSRSSVMGREEALILMEAAQTLKIGLYRLGVSPVTLIGRDEPVLAMGASVSPALFEILGIQPFSGRTFAMADGDPASPPTVILSYGAWQRYFAADPGIVGQSVTLDDTRHVAIGVMPSGFEFPDSLAEFWVPTALAVPPPGTGVMLAGISRLRDGIEIEAAATEANAIMTSLVDPKASERMEIVRIQDELVSPVRPALLILVAAVGFLLLIACSNVANLLLARGTSRHGEIALRAAIGAGRGRLICQTLAETCLLGITGGAAGCVLAFGGVRVLRMIGPDNIPRLESIDIDINVLLFTLVLSIMTGLLFGLVPALQISRVNPMHVIKTSSGMGLTRRRTTQSLIVVSEISLAVILLIGGGLMVGSFVKLSNVDPGFDPRNLIAFKVRLPVPMVPSDAVSRYLRGWGSNLTGEFLARVRALPGVHWIGFSNSLPMQRGPRTGSSSQLSGLTLPDGDFGPMQRTVGGDFFRAMGMPLLGRDFTAADSATQPVPVIVNRATVRRYFPGDNPLGRTFRMAGTPAEIVGIVGDIHSVALDREPLPEMYLPARQTPRPGMDESLALSWGYFALRADRSPRVLIPDVRAVIQQLIPDATVELNAETLQESISVSIAEPRFYAVLLGAFAGVALILASIGIYGVTAYSVSQRTREIGIRIALGARPQTVMGEVLRYTLILAVIGTLLGVGGAVAVTRYLEGMLFGLKALDPLTFVFVPASFAVIASIGAGLAARRATRIDPLAALRHE